MSRSPSSIALEHPRTTIAIMTARISRSLPTTSSTTSDHKLLINDKPYVESNKDKTGHSVNLVDLFAGIGGFHYGVAAAAAQRQLGVRPLLVSEIEESCQEIYQRNHNCDVQGDINKIDLGDFSNLEADIVTAGFPCQPFSNSGRKLGLKDPRGRFYDRIAANDLQHPDGTCSVTPVGFLAATEKDRAFRTHDCLLNPSHWESFGLTVIEAAAYALPAVISEHPNLMSLFPESLRFAARIGDPNGLADAILNSMEFKNFQKLRQFFLDHYQANVFTSKMVDVLQNI